MLCTVTDKLLQVLTRVGVTPARANQFVAVACRRAVGGLMMRW